MSDYQTALRSVTYDNSSGDPSTSTRTVTFQVADDGALTSSPVTRDVTVTAVNDAPVVDTSDAALAYREGDGPVAVDPAVTVADDGLLAGATVQITGNFVAAEDELAFVDQLGIVGSYDDSTGTLTLTGSASMSDYQTALRSVTYDNSSGDPSTSTRTVTFQVTDDGALTSSPVTRDITVTAV